MLRSLAWGWVLAASALAAPDLLVTGGRVLDHPGADAVLCREGRVVAVGSEEVLARRGASGMRRLEAGGGWVLPGFHDAHVHVESGAAASRQPRLQDCEDVACVQRAVAEHAAANPGDGWLLARGWRYELVPDGYPIRQQLDAVVDDRPVMLEAYDGHAQWANSRALRELGLGPATPDPVGGTIVREADGRTPGGVLLEAASGEAEEALPPLPREERLEVLAAGLRDLAALGLTSIEDVSYRLDVVPLYQELDRQGRLPLRVRVALPLGTPLQEVARLHAGLGSGSARLRPGFLKGFLDGVVESRTAWMVDPYPESGSGSGSGSAGGPKKPLEWYRSRVRAAHRAGYQVALHCVGDGAVRAALDLFEEVQGEFPGAPRGHRIEHIEALHPSDARRFRALGVVASMQPYHAVPPDSASEAGTWAANMGPARLPRSFPWRMLRVAGAPLAFGSDWPVLSADPLWGLAVAVSRRNRRGLPTGGWHPAQALPWRAAVRAYTVGGAQAARASGRGAIAPGMDADLTVLMPGVDPARPATLWEGERIRATVVGGVVEVSEMPDRR